MMKTGAAWLFLCIALSVTSTDGNENSLEFRGNEVSLRPAFMSREGLHSFVDKSENATLTRGTLKAFRLYVHNLADDTAVGDVVAQIWRPVRGEDEALQLVWRKHLHLDQRNHLYVVRLAEEEEFHLEQTDVIGFQCESNTCPVSMTITPEGRTYVRRAQTNNLGKVVYDFKGPLAVIFSVGVDILPASVPENSASASDESQPGGNSVTSDVAQELVGPEAFMSSEDVEGIQEPLYSSEQREEMLSNCAFHGNNLTLGDDFWHQEGRKTFIDTSFQLSSGILKAVSLFVHDVSVNLESIDIYLELWTKHGTSATGYRLEWQKRIRLTRGSNRLYEFILDHSDQVVVTDKRILGFSNMDHMCPISFRYSEDGRTLFKTIKRYEGPSEVNSIYHFNEVHEPILFSMGAYVSPHPRPPPSRQDEDENEIELPDTIRTGHAPIQRQYMLPNTPTPKVFVDKNFRFVPGHVTKIIAFVGRLSTEDIASPIKFQIWTYHGTAGQGAETHPVYRLKWQQTFTLSSLTVSTNGNRENTFELNNPVEVNGNDTLGFVSEGRIIPFPYDFNNAISQPSGIGLVDMLPLNRSDDGSIQYPQVRPEVYHFNPHPHPIIWSLAVEIQPLSEDAT